MVTPVPAPADDANRYDRAYFDRWYRSPNSRVSSPAQLRRKAALALAVGEYYLGRPVRTVLDVGCGEGDWRAALRSTRPALHYTGVDPSEYVVARFGRSRGIRRGSFDTLEDIGLADAYDLVVCSNALLYADHDELVAALGSLAVRTRAVAFLELYTADDELEGDRPDALRGATYYRRLLRRSGLHPIGSHCYLGPEAHALATEMESAAR